MGEKIIWTNGCFDVLHRGHIELFKYAKSLGTKLYVGIDTDEKVKRDKGESRPINNQQDRKFILESIKYIDKIFIFDSRTTLEQHIRNIKPNIMVIGSDWKGKVIIGKEIPEEIKYFDRVGDYSTTKILGEV